LFEDRSPFNESIRSSKNRERWSSSIDPNALETGIRNATSALLSQQKPDGHWNYSMEGFAYIPALHVHYLYFIGEEPEGRKAKGIRNYLIRRQLPSGGWSTFPNGPIHISTSVIVYFALKVLGDGETDVHMILARRAIIQHGGVEACNGDVRFRLALSDIVPWSCVPTIPVEILLLPYSFPIFNIFKLAYWIRGTFVPLAVLQAIPDAASNPRKVNVAELFIGKPEDMRPLSRAKQQKWAWWLFFSVADLLLKWAIKWILPKQIRAKAVDAAVTYACKRLNGIDGYCGFTIGMETANMMFHALGYSADHPYRLSLHAAVERHVVYSGEEAFVNTSHSPSWDTSIAMHALLETNQPLALAAAKRGLEWFRPRQQLDVRGKGDWTVARPNLRGGGWAFFYNNVYHPDVDTTAVIVMAIHRLGKNLRTEEILDRGVEWVAGMQSQGGGWGAFEADNTCSFLNNSQYAFPSCEEISEGLLTDKPSTDVTSRCLGMLVQVNQLSLTSDVARNALRFILEAQEENGSWYCRWATNYVHGTWTSLAALNAAGVPSSHPIVQRAVTWFTSVQNQDGGWGEDNRSYMAEYSGFVRAESCASQTAWAILGLIAGGAVNEPAVEGGISYLLRSQNAQTGQWYEERYTGTSFPNMYYLRYGGYAKYFPLLALARFRNMTRNKETILKFVF